MEIRRMKADDANEYWELRLEALQNNPEAFASSYEEAVERKNPLEGVAANLERAVTLGAYDGGLVGVITFVRGSGLKTKHKGDFFAVYVTPSYRGKGAGKALLKEAIDYVKRVDGLVKVNISVSSVNKTAKQLYHNMGFKTYANEEKALYVNGEFLDEEHMVLFL
ncbi:GNAT family N-acetyltransferase [Alkalihalobacillus sp. CinArs1]|uniref:GNAT family N-acetyltransferase n=1 Tax=Alkalihalobacillus sp. CinArs1 TaxID=2995314 RepID=UPI0022DDC277|nr:GNAT family N-acetyltransferase [Alkalihalobacillus sp. CinArs1]